jgi:hypothetical protein
MTAVRHLELMRMLCCRLRFGSGMSWSVRVLEFCWSVEVSECWSVLEWSVGVLVAETLPTQTANPNK